MLPFPFIDTCVFYFVFFLAIDRLIASTIGVIDFRCHFGDADCVVNCLSIASFHFLRVCSIGSFAKCFLSTVLFVHFVCVCPVLAQPVGCTHHVRRGRLGFYSDWCDNLAALFNNLTGMGFSG